MIFDNKNNVSIWTYNWSRTCGCTYLRNKYNSRKIIILLKAYYVHIVGNNVS